MSVIFLCMIFFCNQRAFTAEFKNLLKNGDFEKGSEYPEAWDQPDNLTIFWEKCPSSDKASGKCIRMDTDVYMKDWEKRKEELKRNPHAPARTKTIASGAKYDTIAGNNGVSFYSSPIPVDKGTTYTLSANVRSANPSATPKIFVKGYSLHKGKMREVYKTYLNCRLGSLEWQRFEQDFHPTLKTPNVTEIRVMIFSYWPPGDYWFDNIRIEKSSE